MDTVATHSLNEPPQGGFDHRNYLLGRYGLRMNKREVCFEAKKSRATIDNMRNPRHRSYDPVLAKTELASNDRQENGAPVLFWTVAVADWLDQR